MPVQDPRIVFMGSPEFAVGSLKAILENGYRVVGVITAPDRPSGRGQKVSESPVKQYATRLNLKVLQPERLKDEAFLKQLKQLEADLQVVVAFRMLPEAVWKMPPYGTINLHASLLPQYRGAAPIQWAIMNGEKTTGVTTFFIDHEIDTGSILLREEIDIQPDETAGQLHDRLMEKGAGLVVKTLDQIFGGTSQTIRQDAIKVTGPLRNAPKITKEDCRINWHKKTRDVFNFIRGLSPSPCAWSEISTGKATKHAVKIFLAEIIDEPAHAVPGTVDTDGREYLRVATSDGYIDIRSLQLQGKRRLDTQEFLRGFPEMGSYRFL